jgi:type IX secretion system PorP/SprF family membrane protein
MLKGGFFGTFIFCFALSQAQDPQFSQYYSAPLYLNPAFAGSSGCTRVVSNYRNQWFGLNQPYNTFAFSVDHNIDKYNSGVGFQFLSDQVGKNGISTLDASLFYSYRIDFSKKHSLLAGLQAGIISKHLDILQLTFPDQFTDDGFLNNYSTDYSNKRTRTYFANISTGVLYYSTHFWLGVSAYHLNQPNQTFFSSDGKTRLPVKISLHSGYKFLLGGEKTKSLTPTFLFKHQSSFNQLDLGFFYTTKPLFFGIWYRGIPFLKTVESYTNRDALVFQVGIRFERLNLGYSFDYTLSQLSNFSRGSHEISLGYLFCGRYKKPKERLQTLPCPDFYNNELIR